MFSLVNFALFADRSDGCSHWNQFTQPPTFQPTFAEDVVSNWYPDSMREPDDVTWDGWPMAEVIDFFMNIETPVSVYHTMRWDMLSWHCVATMSADYKDPITFTDPLFRAPVEFQTSYHRALCIMYGRDLMMRRLGYPEAAINEHYDAMTAHQLLDAQLSEAQFDEIAACLEEQTPPADAISVCLDNKRLDIVPENPLSTPSRHRLASAFSAAFVVASIMQDVKTDGFNLLGNLGECTREQNCVPFGDYQGSYEPRNTPWDLTNDWAWQPLIEQDGKGFFYAQEHVTPHIGNAQPRLNRLVGQDTSMFYRTVELPSDFDYDTEIDLVFDRVASLNNLTIAKTIAMDNKLAIIIGVVTSLRALRKPSLEQQALFVVGYTVAEHDAVVSCWREKVRHDRIRPTSVARNVIDEREVSWFDGSDISTKEWTPLIRVMPHSEFPSGSASICRTIADYSQLWADQMFGQRDAKVSTQWTVPKGGAATLKGSADLPAEEITFNLETLEDLAQTCSQSRLWGGMHFTPAVQAGEDLVDGFGQSAFSYTSFLSQTSTNEWSGSQIGSEHQVDSSRVGLEFDDGLPDHMRRLEGTANANLSLPPQSPELLRRRPECSCPTWTVPYDCSNLDAVRNWYPDTLVEPEDILWVSGWGMMEVMMYYFSLETPVSVYHTMRWDLMSWHCVAVMSESYLDPLSNTDPVFRSPADYQNSYHRALCITYARSFYGQRMLTEAIREEHRQQMEFHHLDDDELSEDEFAQVEACIQRDTVEPTSTHVDCLTSLRETLVNTVDRPARHRRMAAFSGAVVAAEIFLEVERDGYNAFGKMTNLTPDDQDREELRHPFGDYTGYKPVNSPWALSDDTRWQPLIENDGKGFSYAQEHVTPHIGQLAPRAAPYEIFTREMELPDDFNYTTEMQLVFDRVASLAGDELRVAQTIQLDNKLAVIIGVVNSIRAIKKPSLEAQALFVSGYTVVEYDAVVSCWREKVRHDRIRPTSVAQHVTDEREVSWYDGSEISTKEWTPLIRVMPHSEFPSGSASICTAIADYSQTWIENVLGPENGVDPGHELVTSWTVAKGAAAGLKGSDMMPSQDVSFTLGNLTELAHKCGQSRLWGGMHFTPAVKAGEDLVAGFGDAAYTWTQSLVNGAGLPDADDMRDPSRDGLEFPDTHDIDHASPHHGGSCDNNCTEIQECPSQPPTDNPTDDPTLAPTDPTPDPTSNPTAAPSGIPTAEPSANPTADPTESPTQAPSPELVACCQAISLSCLSCSSPLLSDDEICDDHPGMSGCPSSSSKMWLWAVCGLLVVILLGVILLCLHQHGRRKAEETQGKTAGGSREASLDSNGSSKSVDKVTPGGDAIKTPGGPRGNANGAQTTELVNLRIQDEQFTPGSVELGNTIRTSV